MIIAANVGALEQASSLLAGAASGVPASRQPPSIGHEGADAALAEFHTSLARHTANLADASGRGAAALSVCAHNFASAGK